MGYIGMCGPKGYGFSAVLIINRVSILNWVFSVRGSSFYISIDKTINKSPSTVPVAMVINWGSSFFCQIINRVGKIADFCHNEGKGFGKRATHPHPIFLGVPPSPWDLA